MPFNPRPDAKATWADEGCIYFLMAEGIGRVKIGWTINHPDDRIVVLQTGCPARLVGLGIIPGPLRDESKHHGSFQSDRLHGEWFADSDRLREYLADRGDDWPGPIPDRATVEGLGVPYFTFVESMGILGIGPSAFRRLLDRYPVRIDRFPNPGRGPRLIQWIALQKLNTMLLEERLIAERADPGERADAMAALKRNWPLWSRERNTERWYRDHPWTIPYGRSAVLKSG